MPDHTVVFEYHLNVSPMAYHDVSRSKIKDIYMQKDQMVTVSHQFSGA